MSDETTTAVATEEAPPEAEATEEEKKDEISDAEIEAYLGISSDDKKTTTRDYKQRLRFLVKRIWDLEMEKNRFAVEIRMFLHIDDKAMVKSLRDQARKSYKAFKWSEDEMERVRKTLRNSGVNVVQEHANAVAFWQGSGVPIDTEVETNDE